MDETPDTSTPEAETSRPPQFTIQSLMILTTAVAVFLALASQTHYIFTAAYVCFLVIATAIWSTKLTQSQEKDSTQLLRSSSLLTLVMMLLASTLASIEIIRTRPMFLEMYSAFGFELLLLNRIVLLTNWFAWLIPSLTLFAILKELLIVNRRVTLTCNLVFLFIVCGLWQLYMIGSAESIINLFHNLAS